MEGKSNMLISNDTKKHLTNPTSVYDKTANNEVWKRHLWVCLFAVLSDFL